MLHSTLPSSLIVCLSLLQSCTAQASWFTRPTEVQLNNGETLELVCTVGGGSCCTGARTWTFESNLIMNNGIPSIANKYSETTDAANSQFSLHISDATIADIEGQYQCTYDFDVSPSQSVSLSNICYEPIESEKQELMKILNGSIYYKVNVTRIFPEPSCTAYLQDSSLTSDLTITSYDNLPLKYSEISLLGAEYTCSDNVIKKLQVNCTMGSCQFLLPEVVISCSEADSESKTGFVCCVYKWLLNIVIVLFVRCMYLTIFIAKLGTIYNNLKKRDRKCIYSQHATVIFTEITISTLIHQLIAIILSYVLHEYTVFCKCNLSLEVVIIVSIVIEGIIEVIQAVIVHLRLSFITGMISQKQRCQCWNKISCKVIPEQEKESDQMFDGKGQNENEKQQEINSLLSIVPGDRPLPKPNLLPPISGKEGQDIAVVEQSTQKEQKPKKTKKRVTKKNDTITETDDQPRNKNTANKNKMDNKTGETQDKTNEDKQVVKTNDDHVENINLDKHYEEADKKIGTNKTKTNNRKENGNMNNIKTVENEMKEKTDNDIEKNKT